MSDEELWAEAERLAEGWSYTSAGRMARLALAERERAEKAEAEVERLRRQVDLLAKQIGDHARDEVNWRTWREQESRRRDEARAERDEARAKRDEALSERMDALVERDELQRGYDTAVEQVEFEMDKRIKAEAERDEWKRRRDNAVETCRFRHQEGLTAKEWHARICGAMQGLERVEAERDEARAEVERRENARLAATVERDTLRAAVAALANALATGTADFMAAYAEAGEGFSTRMSGESAALVVQIRAELEAELRTLLDDPDAALRAVKEAEYQRGLADRNEFHRGDVAYGAGVGAARALHEAADDLRSGRLGLDYTEVADALDERADRIEGGADDA